MPSPWVRLALIVLLFTSLGLKGWRSDAADQPPLQPVNASLVSLLSARDFILTQEEGLEGPTWVADKDDCHVEITQVSLLGWHQSAMVARAGGEALAYAYAGEAYEEQPVMLTKLGYYWHKLANYFYPSSPPPIFGVVTSTGCAAHSIDTALIAQHLRV